MKYHSDKTQSAFLLLLYFYMLKFIPTFSKQQCSKIIDIHEMLMDIHAGLCNTASVAQSCIVDKNINVAILLQGNLCCSWQTFQIIQIKVNNSWLMDTLIPMLIGDVFF